MSVERSGKTIMIKLSDVVVCRAEIRSLIHASCGHNSNQFIEEIVLLSLNFIQTISKIKRGLPT